MKTSGSRGEKRGVIDADKGSAKNARRLGVNRDGRGRVEDERVGGVRRRVGGVVVRVGDECVDASGMVATHVDGRESGDGAIFMSSRGESEWKQWISSMSSVGTLL